MTEIVELEQSQIPSSIGKWKAYPVYKDSGVEWLGEIPEHWETRKLKRLCSFITDGSHYSPVAQLKGKSYVTVRDIIGDTIDVEHAAKISDEDFSLLERNGCKPRLGDVLLTKDGTIGRAAIVARNDFVILSSLAILRPSTVIDSSYLRYYLVSKLGVDQMLSWIAGAALRRLTLNVIVDLIGICPPLSEQRAIATFLDRETGKINQLIARKERFIKLLQEKRAALISHAVTKGLDPDVKMRDSGVEWLGEIPEHWEVRRLKFMASILRGKFSHRPRNDPQLYDGAYPFIQTGDITATTRYITEYQQTLNDMGFAVSKQFPTGTLIMAIAANIGDLAILRFPACFPDSIVGFVPVKQVNLDYLYYNLVAMKQVMMSTATINTQLNLNVERISGLFTVCPPVAEQKAICSYLDREIARIDALISRIGEAIEKLKEYGSALISAAVTGKIDVRGEVGNYREK